MRYIILLVVVGILAGSDTFAIATSGQTVTLHNAAQQGVEMPIIGLGTGAYGTADGNDGEHWNNTVSYEAAKEWIELGGRRIDTSFGYHTEAGIGQAWKDSGVDRSDLFITSKVDLGSYEQVKAQFLQIKEKLQTDYVDLLLVHWPGEQHPSNNLPCKKGELSYKKCRQESWSALLDIYAESGARAIGVSNFEVDHLMDIFEMKKLIPSVNQVEFHIYWHEDGLLDFCKKNNIQFNSYSPLGAPDHMAFHPSSWGVPLLTHPKIQAIAEAHNKSTAQVMLRWALQQDIVVNPRTCNPSHMEENLNVFDFELTFEEMAKLSFLQNPKMYKVCEDPRLMP